MAPDVCIELCLPISNRATQSISVYCLPAVVLVKHAIKQYLHCIDLTAFLLSWANNDACLLSFLPALSFINSFK